MAIDKLPPGLGNSTQVVGGNKYPAPAKSQGRQDTAPPAQQDSVSLTPEARQLNRMQQSLTAPAADNSARLEALKKAINEGSYKVDSERLAANIANLEQDIEKLYS
ncbi:flagellar biosynthesis anti-sigma factor FlgM [Zobellella denitrificans]|jgi:negative regulator of flagellin synthesis FlgM|uniref:flagellar biosynthesis anti-sigma factor FlgM n=1 Tax=Zobellella denitrificans TaxID=347534 RepID=UPI000B8C4C5C|nr:flagellar biosynthesis anti-sigma factor FlgM [Zobellella denitrificans]OXS14389.1 flagellar biosynthesis anti-sigma factor FlgM [Zobellella denitrificans]